MTTSIDCDKPFNHKKQGSNKVIVIGLDSADPNLVEHWMEEGRLPFLKSLVSQGIMARVSSIASGFSDAPWLSFYTGVRPGKHGCYNFLEMNRESREIFRTNATLCPFPPFWSLLRSTEKKVGIFDVPKTYPIEGLDGIQISAWGEEYPLIKACSLPKNLLAEITSRFGRYEHPREILNPRLIFQQVRRYRKLMSAIKQKLKAVKFVMSQENSWDLFMTSFGEAHYANHLFYHLWDRSHWAYNSELGNKLGEALPNIYSKLDSAVKTLLEDVPEDVTVLIVSVHGVSTNYSANHLMPEILEKLGFQANVGSQSSDSKLSSNTLLQSLRDFVPMPIRDFINDWIVPQSFHDKSHSQQFISSIDWHNTRAFFLPLGHFQAFVSINLKGRDPYGTVEPEDYQQICREITDELKCLVNPDTGKPAVHDVIQISEILEGERLYQLPDLIIKWAEDVPINKLHHPKFGLISGEYYGLRKTQHTGNGFVIAKGKHINQGIDISNIRAIDLPPTILYLMGQPIPEYMEGRVLFELISNNLKTNSKA
ncbi:MAG: alkaline phosphatase family protein [Cyanobacteria bacterium P01_D01_bin.50]